MENSGYRGLWTNHVSAFAYELGGGGISRLIRFIYNTYLYLVDLLLIILLTLCKSLLTEAEYHRNDSGGQNKRNVA